MSDRGGPLQGLRVIELAGIGPAPFAAMMLADLGADVVRVDRPAAVGSGITGDVMLRGRRSIAIDLKHPEGPGVLLDLVAHADALIEGFRPGVLERLGVGPEVCLAHNPRLVVGRMTGWGQDGPLADTAGHDINYISVAGALAHMRRAGEPPTPPLNLVGDFGGGGMLLAFGLMSALWETARSGQGQVVDAAMIDGTATLMTMFWSFRHFGLFDEQAPGTNLLDSGAPFYDVYECADGGFVAVGALEPQFYAELLARLDLADDSAFARQMDRTSWPDQRRRLTKRFRTRARDEWAEHFARGNACVTPVLTMTEAAEHPHVRARQTIVAPDGVSQPAPAPRFSRTRAELGDPPAVPGRHSRDVLESWGVPSDRVDTLLGSGAVVEDGAPPPH
ncbi:CaiB/BaiF CoA-transferase family protein [soil metagenome]